MVDYARLIAEEMTRRDSAIAIIDSQAKREIELHSLFMNVEFSLGDEVAKANHELDKRSSPNIGGPVRPDKNENEIELSFGPRNPCFRLTVKSAEGLPGLSKLHAELLDEAGTIIDQTDFEIEGNGNDLSVYKPIVEGSPNRASALTAAEIGQEVVTGIIRGRFA
jgi:hypothetical protein